MNKNSILTRIMNIEPVRRQSIVTIIGQIAFTLIGFLSTMYFAHTVGASILGAYFLFVAYFGILTLLGEGGFGGAAVKRISEGKEQNEYFSAFVALRVILLVVSISILLLARPLFIDLNNSGLFSWLLVALIVGVFSSSVSKGIYGLSKVGVYQISGFFNSTGRVIFQIVAIFFGFGVAGLAGGFVFGMVASGMLGLRFMELRFVRFGSRHLKSMLSFSFWIFLASGGSLVFNYADTVAIGYFLENADVGIYRVTFLFTSVATFTTVAMRTVLFPKVSNWSTQGNFDMVETALAKGFTYSLLLAIPVFVGGLLLGERMLFFFYGADFVRGVSVLYLLLAAQVVNVFMYIQTMYLSALNHPKKAFKVVAVASTANILLDLILIPLFGIMGAAVATLLTMTLNAVLAYRVLSKLINVRLESKSVWNILLSSFIMGAFLVSYRLLISLSSVWLTLLPVVAGGVFYAVLLLKFDTNIHDELQAMVVQVGMPWPRWL